MYKTSKETLEKKQSSYELGLLKLNETEQIVSELQENLKIV